MYTMEVIKCIVHKLEVHLVLPAEVVAALNIRGHLAAARGRPGKVR